MNRVQHSEKIDAPVEAAFAFVDDYRNTTKYMKDLTRWNPVDPHRTHGKGATFDVTMSAGPLKLASTVEMDAWVENREISWHSTSGLKQKGSWSFKPAAGGSEATLALEYEMPGGMAGRIIARGAEPVVRSNIQRSVKKLAELVAKRAASPARSTAAPAKGAAASTTKAKAKLTTKTQPKAKAKAKAQPKSKARAAAKTTRQSAAKPASAASKGSRTKPS